MIYMVNAEGAKVCLLLDVKVAWASWVPDPQQCFQGHEKTCMLIAC